MEVGASGRDILTIESHELVCACPIDGVQSSVVRAVLLFVSLFARVIDTVLILESSHPARSLALKTV